MKRLLLLCVLGITGSAASGCIYHDREPYRVRRDVYYEPVPARWHERGEYWHRDRDGRWYHDHDRGYY